MLDTLTPPPTRTPDLDEVAAEVAAALAHVTHMLEAGQHVTPGTLAQAEFDKTTLQRYLGAYYPSGHSDATVEFRWTLDQARHAGIA